jgi:hypothetical protein
MNFFQRNRAVLLEDKEIRDFLKKNSSKFKDIAQKLEQED